MRQQTKISAGQKLNSLAIKITLAYPKLGILSIPTKANNADIFSRFVKDMGVSQCFLEDVYPEPCESFEIYSTDTLKDHSGNIKANTVNKITLKDKIEIAEISDREEEDQESEELNTDKTKQNSTQHKSNAVP